LADVEKYRFYKGFLLGCPLRSGTFRDEHPEKMRQRRETVEHPFGTIKARMGATHFLMKTLPRVASEMALHVLAYNLTRVINLIGVQPLMAAMRA
jgi:Transposase DDE domain